MKGEKILQNNKESKIQTKMIKMKKPQVRPKGHLAARGCECSSPLATTKRLGLDPPPKGPENLGASIKMKMKPNERNEHTRTTAATVSDEVQTMNENRAKKESWDFWRSLTICGNFLIRVC